MAKNSEFCCVRKCIINLIELRHIKKKFIILLVEAIFYCYWREYLKREKNNEGKV